jgi:CubicO group peptidase (beta-lactamase class C family)
VNWYRRLGVLLGTVVLSVLAAVTASATSPAESSTEKIEAVLPQTGSADVPGCAVGVRAGDNPSVLRAFGMADLEHTVPVTPDTVFEAGSVSKQFTAAAALILVGEGRLSLQDDVRKYLPELPDYGHPITVAELMGHTSGLRDWGDIEAIAGWPRTERVYSLDDVLYIASRQHVLNYEPGTAWSYTNTGFNLLAFVVQRVSGTSFVEFTRQRLFEPLGMTHTQWRDNFRHVVRDRAIAYRRVQGIYEQLMPFENTYAHGGLLTTVGDLLLWNKALDEGRLGLSVTQALETRTLLLNGKPTVYARGLFVRSYRGMRELSHDGATAGYRAWLGRFPDQRLSIAVLCNADDAVPSKLAHAVADLYLPKTAQAKALYTLKPPAGLAGLYASERDGVPLRLSFHGERLETEANLTILMGSHQTLGFIRPDGVIAETGQLLPDGRLRRDNEGDATFYDRVEAAAPTPTDLARVAGRYRNDEVPVTYRVTAVSGGLNVVAEGRPDTNRLFVPAYSNAYAAGDTVLRPVVGADGGMTGIRVSDDRVWNLQLYRLP